MVRVEVLRKRLNKLDEYLRILTRLQRYSFEEFMADPERYGSVERFLHLAIETLTDMGNHVVADLNLGVVDWYSDIPKRIREYGYIDEAFERKWIRMIGFRSTLVHEYVDIDRKIVYQILQENLEDMRSLRKMFAEFL
jgi:uncharacterized protein YutE (UPF0331/DUF86 family)